MAGDLANYTFLPWLRQGVASQIVEKDTLGNGDGSSKERAELLATYYWERRHPESNLIAERPNAGTDRFDGAHFVTSSAGPFCGALLRAYVDTKSPMFLDQALTYLRAYGAYGYDASANAYGPRSSEPVSVTSMVTCTSSFVGIT